ncbi:MAG TPA: carbon-nitrogen hydrolase family protein [Propylenella sp.]
MGGKFKAACIQLTAAPGVDASLEKSLRLTREAAAAGADLIALPEFFCGLATQGSRIVPAALPEEKHPALAAFAALSREFGLSILLGSLGVVRPDGRIANRSYVVDPEGRVTARYDKIHLFDVNLGEGKNYRESETIAPGAAAVVAATPWGGLGLTVCYDLRFPQLYRALAQAGATMLAVPAAFTRLTGEAHWHVLVRARAIENGAFVIAPCQTGTLSGGGECFGHSLIVDPWGRVLADGGEAEGVVLAEIDPPAVALARSRIPSLSHDRAFTVDPPRIALHARRA